MYEKVIEKDVPISYEEPEYIDYVKSFDAAGLYTIIDEDLEEFFPILRYDVGLISVTAMALHKYGYLITEVFDNGFPYIFVTIRRQGSFIVVYMMS